MREREIKAATLNKLMSSGALRRNDVVINEYTLFNSHSRADLAILRDDIFTAIEIKSEFDNLSRLEKQIEDYKNFFDHVIVVISDAHSSRMTPDIAEYVTLWTIDSHGFISGNPNPKITKRLPNEKLLKNLTKKEYSRLDYQLPLQKHCADVRRNINDQIKSRFHETSERFWRAVKRTIRVDQIELLSRFSEERQRQLSNKSLYETRWTTWRNEASAYFSSQIN